MEFNRNQNNLHQRQDSLHQTSMEDAFDDMETGVEALAEDIIRLKGVKLALDKHRANIDVGAARDLEECLYHACFEDWPWDSLASKQTMLNERIRFVRDVTSLVDSSMGYDVSSGTVLPRSFEIPDKELESFDPEKEKKALSSYLNRRGIGECKGWLIAGLHGEYDSSRKIWRIHWHLLVCGEMINVIDNLRNEWNFQSAKGEAPRVRMSRQPLTDIPRVASYLLQSWWPNRPTGMFAGDGVNHRKNRSRLPEPQQTRWLLWMDRNKMSDLVLLRGVRRGPSGFKITNL